MKRLLLLVASPLLLAGCVDVVSRVSLGDDNGVARGGPRAVGTGKPVAETRRAEAATAAEFSGALTVEIRKGAPALTIEAQKEILPHIKSEFKGGRLRVWTEGNMNTDGTMRVRLTMPSLSEVEASGATTVDGVSLSGKSARIVLSGASKAKASGKVDNLSVEASGASEANLTSVECAKARIEANGASQVWVGPSQSLDAAASGASMIRYRGAPHVAADASGASTIEPAK